MHTVTTRQYYVSATITSRADNSTWSLTGVYGPQEDPAKLQFIAELRSIKQQMLPGWVIMGDFNLIYRSCDKSNERINRSLMNRFKSALDNLELKEIHLHGRKFTWSSETDNPTFTKIDHVFCTRDWELAHQHCYMQALSSSASDHCPMLLTCTPFHRKFTGFRFASYWLHLPGFAETVVDSWTKPFSSADKIRVLHVKLARLGKALKKRSRGTVEEWKRRTEIAQEVVLRLDQAQEHRSLTPEEFSLRKRAKQRILGFAALGRIKIRQRSRLTWIREGDANTKLFHLRATACRRKNYIPAFRTATGMVTAHQDKAQALLHYTQQLGSCPTRPHILDWDFLDIQAHNLDRLDVQLTEEEVRRAVFDTPAEKAPGPDGYNGLFYRTCWQVICHDLMQALHQLYNLRAQNWNLLNSANVVLLPKKENPEAITDYRPISLMHSVAKILGKVRANRLAPHLNDIVSSSQSAFIKGRSIHDNFQYIHGAVNHFHRTKTPMLFMKLDIAKAFDNVRWEYMLEVLEKLGFAQRWRDIISLVWSTTSSRILLNGEPGQPIKHRRGLRHGDPLSPMLFILAMDPLQRVLDKATAHGLLQPIGTDPIKLRTSLFADDAALFLRPSEQDMINLQQILQCFGEATGLFTNMQKSELYPINCMDTDLATVTSIFTGRTCQFPCRYLRLPLLDFRAGKAVYSPKQED